MRFDKEIELVRDGKEEFDPITGEYIIADGVSLHVWANVSDTGEQTQTALYGNLKTGAYTIRVQERPHEFEYMLIDGEKYGVDRVKKFRRDTVFFVSERHG